MAHVRLMFLFSQIYVKMKENIAINSEERESYWTKEDRMTNLSELLILFGDKYHSTEFQTYFFSRCHILGPRALIALDKISQCFRNEK